MVTQAFSIKWKADLVKISVKRKSSVKNFINDPLTSAFGRTGRYSIDDDVDKNPFKFHIRIL